MAVFQLDILSNRGSFAHACPWASIVSPTFSSFIVSPPCISQSLALLQTNVPLRPRGNRTNNNGRDDARGARAHTTITAVEAFKSTMILEGFLYKQGECVRDADTIGESATVELLTTLFLCTHAADVVKNWRLRFFVLQPAPEPLLIYYRNVNGGEPPANMLALDGAHVVVSNGCGAGGRPGFCRQILRSRALLLNRCWRQTAAGSCTDLMSSPMGRFIIWRRRRLRSAWLGWTV